MKNMAIEAARRIRRRTNGASGNAAKAGTAASVRTAEKIGGLGIPGEKTGKNGRTGNGSSPTQSRGRRRRKAASAENGSQKRKKRVKEVAVKTTLLLQRHKQHKQHKHKLQMPQVEEDVVDATDVDKGHKTTAARCQTQAVGQILAPQEAPESMAVRVVEAMRAVQKDTQPTMVTEHPIKVAHRTRAAEPQNKEVPESMAVRVVEAMRAVQKDTQPAMVTEYPIKVAHRTRAAEPQNKAERQVARAVDKADKARMVVAAAQAHKVPTMDMPTTVITTGMQQKAVILIGIGATDTGEWCQPLTSHFGEKEAKDPAAVATRTSTGLGTEDTTMTILSLRAPMAKCSMRSITTNLLPSRR